MLTSFFYEESLQIRDSYTQVRLERKAGTEALPLMLDSGPGIMPNENKVVPL